MSNLRLYILMRNDLASMPPGRCMAQAAHAANTLVATYGKQAPVKAWQKQTKQGFGTTIVLSASLPVIEEILRDPRLKRWPFKGLVIDPEYGIRVTHEVAQLLSQNYDAKFCNYTFDYSIADDKTVAVIRQEVTCAYILGTKEDLTMVQYLPLY